MRVSIITAVFNGVSSISDCMRSVSRQTYSDIEHLIMDGGSTDNTLHVVDTCKTPIAKIISEPDKGMYDALNKGISMASGELIGFLHADDIYAGENIIETVVNRLTRDKVDSCYGDLLYVDRKNLGKVIRYWKSCSYRDGLFQRGWMPPHPTFFVRRSIYEKYGSFNTNFKIAADYELMLRFLVKHRISTIHIPEVLIKMRMGGMSNRSLKNLVLKTFEDYRAWSSNDLQRKIYTIPFKNLSKIRQFFSRGVAL